MAKRGRRTQPGRPLTFGPVTDQPGGRWQVIYANLTAESEPRSGAEPGLSM